ncbi:hypothetical protein [Arthrobacter monumenti]
MLNPINTGRILAQDIENPLEGVTPTLSVFGTEFNATIVAILGGLWAICVLIAVGAFLMGLGKYSVAKKTGHSDDLSDGAGGMKKAGLAIAGLAAAPAIIAGIIFVASI